MNKFIAALVNEYKQPDKEFFLENQDELIDVGIRELTDALNEYRDIVTINSCQGGLIPEDAKYHCPLTYVDFYVLNRNYVVAESLLVKLSSTFTQQIMCRLEFEPDFYLIDENTAEDNGYINYRYRIQIEDPEVYEDVIQAIEDFRKDYNY